MKVSEFLNFWLEEDIKKRTNRHETYYNYCGVVKNHINPLLGEKKMTDVNRGDIQKLFNTKATYSRSVAEQVKTIMNVSFKFALSKKIISSNPVKGVNLPKAEKSQRKNVFRTRSIDSSRTLTLEQIQLLIEKSKNTPIHMQVLFNVLMGLRRSEINGLKYSDIVFEAIVEERQIYEENRKRRINDRTNPFYDGNYICCSTYGKPRSKGFHWKYYKQLLAENGLPDIRWHDLRSTYCTLLLKENFNPKAVSKLMGHAKEIITIDTYGDNKNIIADGIPEIEKYMNEVLPDPEQERLFQQELLEIVVDVSEYISKMA